MHCRFMASFYIFIKIQKPYRYGNVVYIKSQHSNTEEIKCSCLSIRIYCSNVFSNLQFTGSNYCFLCHVFIVCIYCLVIYVSRYRRYVIKILSYVSNSFRSRSNTSFSASRTLNYLLNISKWSIDSKPDGGCILKEVRI